MKKILNYEKKVFEYEILATILSGRYTCYNLKFLLIIFWCSIFMCKSSALHLCWHQLARLNKRQRGETIWFLLGGEDRNYVSKRFHILQPTNFRLWCRMLTAGCLNNHLRSTRPKVTTRRQVTETRLLHLRNRFQVAVKTAAHFWEHNNGT
jgi:hypothetical protein